MSQADAGVVETPAHDAGNSGEPTPSSGGSAGATPTAGASSVPAGNTAGIGPDGAPAAGAASGAPHSTPSAGAASDAPPTELPDKASFIQPLAAAVCDALKECVGPTALVSLVGRENCVTSIAASLEQNDFGSLEQSIANRSVVIDATKLESCYQDMRALRCKFQTERIPESCQLAIQGQRKAGETCRDDVECADDTFCPIDGACPRLCQPLKARDESCDRDAECRRGLICSGGTCDPPVPDTGTCGGPSGGVCELGMTCLGSTDSVAGKCRRNSSILTKALDEVCDPNSGPLCREGLSCAFAGNSKFKCQAPVGKDSDCHLGVPGQCPADSYCNAKDLMSKGTCTALPQETETCAIGGLCAAGHVCFILDSTATCRRLANLGETCLEDVLCRSGTCVDGRCATRATCE